MDAHRSQPVSFIDDISPVNHLRKGDRNALAFIFKLYFRPLLAFDITYTRNKQQAEDLVQQSFLDLWEHRHQLHPQKSPKNYLYTITRNLFLDSIKKRQQEFWLKKELMEQFTPPKYFSTDSDNDERLQRLNFAISQLPERCRTILIMHKKQGFVSNTNVGDKTLK